VGGCGDEVWRERDGVWRERDGVWRERAGVLRERAGVLREREERSGMEFKGRAFGDGGMARPSRGGRPVVLREPGIGGRRSGAGLDMYGAS
jgi:hypothetical protein